MSSANTLSGLGGVSEHGTPSTCVGPLRTTCVVGQVREHERKAMLIVSPYHPLRNGVVAAHVHH